jgi:nucleotide-binding universal stress UspA family protein
MTNQIVVGYDSSPSSTEAVRWASFQAAASHRKLRIVSCYGVPMTAAAGAMWLSGAVLSSIEEETVARAEAVRALAVTRHPDLAIDLDVCLGPPRESLLVDLATDDMLVVGASSHEGASAFWLGSTSRWVTRHSPCPVVVVRGTASRDRPDRIVVGIDGSPASDAAVLWAADEADLHGVELLVVHGWEYPYLGVGTHAEQVRDLTRIDAALVLDRSVELARERCGVTVKDVLFEGAAATALLDSVRDGDVLVLGADGRGAIAAGLLGSTVNRVVERSAVPVVVVH